MILHILNGDCALSGWSQCNFPGEALVWRENYLQGNIPEAADYENFNYIRAEELHKIAPEKSVDAIFYELQAMHQKVFSLHTDDKLVLWLDFCPFDQALKKQLLKLVAVQPEKPDIYLVQQDVIWNKEAFEKYRNWENVQYIFGKYTG